MTDDQFNRLWHLLDSVGLTREEADAVDFCLKNNSYVTDGNGWDGLIGWLTRLR